MKQAFYNKSYNLTCCHRFWLESTSSLTLSVNVQTHTHMIVDTQQLHEIKGDIAGIAFVMVYRIGYDYQPYEFVFIFSR